MNTPEQYTNTHWQSESHRLVYFVHVKRYGILFFWKELRHCYCDFQPVLRDIGELFTPENGSIREYWCILVSIWWNHSSYGRYSWVILQEISNNRLILREDVAWHPRSPVWNPCNYLLWGTSNLKCLNIILKPLNNSWN